VPAVVQIAPPVQLAQPYAGDCAVTVTLPADANSTDVHVSINLRSMNIEPVQQAPFDGLLKDPLALNSNVTVTMQGQCHNAIDASAFAAY
jgi:hypothetical protein